MKNFILCFAVSFCTLFASAKGNHLSQEQDEISAKIERHLSKSEESINEVEFDEALNQLNRALELSRSIDHQRYIALSSSMMAQLYYVRHEYDKAATELQRAVAIQRKIEDKEGLAYSYVNYGKIFNAERNYERSDEYLQLAKEIYTENDDTEGLGIVALNKGILAINTE